MERIRKLAKIFVTASKCPPTLEEDMISGLMDILDYSSKYNTSIESKMRLSNDLLTGRGATKQLKSTIMNPQVSSCVTGKFTLI